MSRVSVFEMKPEHVLLLRKANIQWDGALCGSPHIDPKRPYGSGDHIRDIAEILGEGGAVCPHCQEPLNKRDEERFEQLHRETEAALEVALATAEIRTGRYEHGRSGWVLHTKARG